MEDKVTTEKIVVGGWYVAKASGRLTVVQVTSVQMGVRYHRISAINLVTNRKVTLSSQVQVIAPVPKAWRPGMAVPAQQTCRRRGCQRLSLPGRKLCERHDVALKDRRPDVPVCGVEGCGDEAGYGHTHCEWHRLHHRFPPGGEADPVLVCPPCHGTGLRRPGSTEVCPRCGGSKVAQVQGTAILLPPAGGVPAVDKTESGG